MSAELFRNILYSLAGLSLGAASYALITYSFLLSDKTRRVSTVGHMLVKTSWILTVGVIFWTIIIPITQIPPTLEGWLFALGTLMGAVGFVMVARSERRSIVRRG